jgi:hypothetical protein
MTPLAPLYLLAALAVAGPILFHLWRRTPRGRREFSTLMFLTPSPPRVTSRSRVEHWLLLLMRAAVLCLLALAFARPMWRTATSEPEQAVDEELVAVLIDTSASLRRDGAWPDLMRQVNEHISKLPSTATIGLFQFDDRWSAVADFAELKRLEPGQRRELVKARLEDVKPGWGGTNLGEALVRTASALQETQTDRAIPAKLRIVLASDLQSGTNLDALNGFEWPEELRLELLDVRPKSTSNAGVQWVERNLDLPDDVQRVRVTNAADSTKEQFSIHWSGDDSAALSVYVPPGQSRVVVPPERPKDASVTSLVLKGDDNDFDNTLYSAAIREENRLVVYSGTDSPDDTAGLRFYLEGVYAASQRYKVQVSGWRDALPTLSAERPALVVLVEPEADAAGFVKSHLSQSGTVLLAARSADSLSQLLEVCGVPGTTVTEAVVKRDAMLGDIDFEHPLFAPFAESQFSDFTGVRFWKHRSLAGFALPDNVQSADTESSGSDPHAGRVLARFDNGDPAFVEFRAGPGRVWVLTAGWHPADSQLARSSKFPPLMYRMLELASGAVHRPQSLAVGNALAWPRSTGETPTTSETRSKGTVRGPVGISLTDLPTDLPFAATRAPGLYTLEVNGVSETVAVNLAAEESRTAPLPIEHLESLGVRLGTAETAEDIRRAKDRERQLQVEELEQTQKLWRWGVLAAIVLLLAETWLAGRRVSAVSAVSTDPS